jgi:hypothetical protein
MQLKVNSGRETGEDRKRKIERQRRKNLKTCDAKVEILRRKQGEKAPRNKIQDKKKNTIMTDLTVHEIKRDRWNEAHEVYKKLT